MHQFIVNKTYNRSRDIHDIYGGNRQSGISLSKNFPYIFLFAGSTGHDYGYKDKWENDIFNFFGEGQTGDMSFTKGNKAVRDHSSLGKDLLLFETIEKGQPVKFLGEFICESYKEVIAKDKNNNDRNALVFQLRKAENVQDELNVEDNIENSLEILRKIAYEAASSATQKLSNIQLRTIRERRKDVKIYALKRANGVCECCGIKAPFEDINGRPFLEVHHIHKLSDSGLDSPENVAAITPNCHAKIHHGKNGQEIDRKLSDIISKKEKSKIL